MSVTGVRIFLLIGASRERILQSYYEEISKGLKLAGKQISKEFPILA